MGGNVFGAFDRLRNDESLRSFPVYTNAAGDDSSSYVGRNLHRLVPGPTISWEGITTSDLFEGHQDDGLLFCHVPTMLRYSTWNQEGTVETTTPMTRMVAYSGSVGALLAMQHFNTGNGTVVDELEGINERCPIRLTTEVMM